MANLERFVPKVVGTKTIRTLDFYERISLAHRELDKSEDNLLAFWITVGTLSATNLALKLTNLDLPETIENSGVVAAFGLIGLTSINAAISNMNAKRALKNI